MQPQRTSAENECERQQWASRQGTKCPLPSDSPWKSPAATLELRRHFNATLAHSPPNLRLQTAWAELLFAAISPPSAVLALRRDTDSTALKTLLRSCCCALCRSSRSEPYAGTLAKHRHTGQARVSEPHTPTYMCRQRVAAEAEHDSAVMPRSSGTCVLHRLKVPHRHDRDTSTAFSYCVLKDFLVLDTTTASYCVALVSGRGGHGLPSVTCLLSYAAA